VTNIADELEIEFSAHAQVDREVRITELERLAAAADEPLVVRSSGKNFIGLGALAVPMLLVATLAPLEWALRVLLVGCSVFVLVAGVVLWRLAKKPVMTLTADAIVFSDADTRIAWTCVRDYSALLVNGNVSLLRVELRPDAEMPPFRKCLHRYRYDVRAKKELVFNGIGPLVGLEPQEFLDRFGGFLAASRARAELARLRGA